MISNTRIEMVSAQLIDHHALQKQYRVLPRDMKIFLHNVSAIEPRDQELFVSIGKLSYIIQTNQLTLLTLDRDTITDLDVTPEELESAISTALEQDRESVLRYNTELLLLDAVFNVYIEKLLNRFGSIHLVVSRGLQHQTIGRLEKERQTLNRITTSASQARDAITYLLDSDLDILRLCFANQRVHAQSHQLNCVLNSSPFHLMQLGLPSDSEDSSSSDSVEDEDFPVRLNVLIDFMETHLFRLQELIAQAESVEQTISSHISFERLHLARRRNLFLYLDLLISILSCGFVVANSIGIVLGANVLNPWNDAPPGPLLRRTTGQFLAINFLILVFGWFGFTFAASCIMSYLMTRRRKGRKGSYRPSS
ncbi:Metal ion transporter CorA-like divalent cation transporter family protein [Giardia muris]|uniref:Metal ion transporter CorA-like divalent cation transporter family protein n=1 Tax=Giardia muris TaxID=5742 RepID=A0A4Z1TBW7_GIAMU|nr:Metal ion transporter CorA-like divalent cation transporter family protein [Giardia muris]|eukprot:TNJ30029.1 Metal ion transporter CorA-like divalent cation transporter family protein [Giardia muris]